MKTKPTQNQATISFFDSVAQGSLGFLNSRFAWGSFSFWH